MIERLLLNNKKTMRKIFLICSLLFCSLLVVSCSDDDEQLQPSGEEKNWWVLEDSDDPIDHLRYEIFQDMDVPIYYNDTIGSMTRYNFMGQPYTYYEILRVFYNPGTTKPTASLNYYRLIPMSQKSQLESLLEGIREVVLSPLKDKIYIPSLLLVDTLKSSLGELVYRGFNTIVIGDVLQYGDLSAVEQNEYLNNILSTIVAYDIYSNFSDFLTEQFYLLSNQLNPNASGGVYEKMIYIAAGTAVPQTLAALGFLKPKTDPGTLAERMWTTPTKQQDVQHYCAAIFSMPESVFKEEHAEDEVILQKYDVMKSLLIREYGFSFE